MGISILMKIVTLHKSTIQQITIAVFFCGVLFLRIDSYGQFDDQSKNLGLIAIGPSLTFDHPDVCFIESLLRLSFFDIAIETCRDRRRIADGTQPEATAQWLLLEMHSLAAKVAADSSIVDEPETATTLLKPIQTIIENNPDSPRLLWLKHRQQWCRWLILRRMLATYMAVPARTRIREWSLITIRDCLAELDSLQTQIQNTPARKARSVSKSDPTSEQWIGLINDTFLLQTDFQLLRALYYPAKSTERIAAATEMLTSIEKAELRINVEWSGRPNIDLARCTALIHLDRPADALSGIESLNRRLNSPVDGKPKQGNRWRQRIATLAAEACRNQGKFKEAGEWLDSVGGWTMSPEIAIEHFANLVAALTGKSKSESQLSNALQVKKEIGQRFGSYWQQRADAILVSNNLINGVDAAETNGSTTSSATFKVELLMSEAKQLLAAKQFNAAIEKLSQAELSAASAGNETLALDIAIQAAAVLFKNGQKEVAEGEFHRAAIAYRKQPKAPDAAIMSVWSFDRVMRFAPDEALSTVKQEESELQQQVIRGRLLDIIRNWPSTPQANQAVAKLDGLYLATDNLTELIDLWSKRLDQIFGPQLNFQPDQHKWSDFDEALSRYALVATVTQDAWYDHSIFITDSVKGLGPSLDNLRTKLIEFASPNDRAAVRSILTSIVESSRWPSPVISASNAPSQKAFSSVSVTVLNQAFTGPSQTRIAEVDATFSAARVNETTSLALKWTLTELLFQQLLQSGIRGHIDQTHFVSFGTCVELLSKSEQQGNQTRNASLGNLQNMQLNRSMQLYRGAVQCWSGEEAAGVAALKAAISQGGKTPWWTYRTARLFQTLNGQREQAIKQFRQVANGYSAGTEPWLESKARAVQTMRSMGNTEAAKELTELVFLTFPALAREWQSRFIQ